MEKVNSSSRNHSRSEKVYHCFFNFRRLICGMLLRNEGRWVMPWWISGDLFLRRRRIWSTNRLKNTHSAVRSTLKWIVRRHYKPIKRSLFSTNQRSIQESLIWRRKSAKEIFSWIVRKRMMRVLWGKPKRAKSDSCSPHQNKHIRKAYTFLLLWKMILWMKLVKVIMGRMMWDRRSINILKNRRGLERSKQNLKKKRGKWMNWQTYMIIWYK